MIKIKTQLGRTFAFAAKLLGFYEAQQSRPFTHGLLQAGHPLSPADVPPTSPEPVRIILPSALWSQ